MNILKKLIDISNKLDEKGLHAEASVLDGIIKEAEGFREQLAPGLLGPEQSGKMAPGSGAGGLPGSTVSPPENEAGVASKRKRGVAPKVLAFQKRYNNMYGWLQKLRIMDQSQMRNSFGPPLSEDGIPGPKTKAARGSLNQIIKLITREISLQEEKEQKDDGQRRGADIGTPVTIDVPEVKMPGVVDLGPKPEVKLT